jgi:hypothetical protein
MAFNMNGLNHRQMYSIYNWREYLVPAENNNLCHNKIEDGDNKQVYVLHQQQKEVERDSNRYELNTSNTNPVDSSK